MAIELSYALITPYTLQKSRTGGIIARLLSRTDLDLVGAKIFAPTNEFTKQYADFIKNIKDNTHPQAIDALAEYVKENFPPYEGRYQRVMLLLFRGEDAIKKLTDIVGNMRLEVKTGEKIRDTYADYVLNRDGSIRYFEPAVIISPDITTDRETYKKEMLFMANFLDSAPNIISNPLLDAEDDSSKRTLVIIKPDNWRHPSSRPGNIIDMLSKTGLRIVGCKIYRMSVEEALEFYGPVKDALKKKLSPKIGKQAKEILERELKINLDDADTEQLTKSVGEKFANDQFSQIITFMSGVRPEDITPTELDAPGKVKCMVLIYQGENAVEKIREVLGPTDPTKAPGGTIRRDFGTDVMVNTAHASDSFENAKREMGIVKIEKNDIGYIIKNFYK